MHEGQTLGRACEVFLIDGRGNETGLFLIHYMEQNWSDTGQSDGICHHMTCVVEEIVLHFMDMQRAVDTRCLQ